jgi:ABC-type transport system involved in multi-copper enzyme maturation permease subunit
MSQADVALHTGIGHAGSASPFGALLAKEWREQRWRFFLSAFVLSTLNAGLLRAQVVPYSEAVLAVYWPVGAMIVIFLAIGPVAGEQEDRTWEFLLARPISRADILTVKWAMGLLQLVGIMTIATVAGVIAMVSREFPARVVPLISSYGSDGTIASSQGLLDWIATHPVAWLCVVALAATVALASLYTPLFLILTRGRSEFAAALAAILLAVVVHLWLGQFILSWPMRLAGWANPLSPLVVATLYPGRQQWLALILPLHMAMWIALPVWLMRRLTRKAGAA